MTDDNDDSVPIESRMVDPDLFLAMTTFSINKSEIMGSFADGEVFDVYSMVFQCSDLSANKSVYASVLAPMHSFGQMLARIEAALRLAGDWDRVVALRDQHLEELWHRWPVEAMGPRPPASTMGRTVVDGLGSGST